jgi:hypothetical protein
VRFWFGGFQVFNPLHELVSENKNAGFSASEFGRLFDLPNRFLKDLDYGIGRVMRHTKRPGLSRANSLNV